MFQPLLPFLLLLLFMLMMMMAKMRENGNKIFPVCA